MIASTMKMITSHFAMSIEGHAMLVTPLAVARFIYEREPSVEAFAISLFLVMFATAVLAVALPG